MASLSAPQQVETTAAVLVLAMCAAAVVALGCPVLRLPQADMIAAYQHIMRGSSLLPLMTTVGCWP
jgi:hypothetical protein